MKNIIHINISQKLPKIAGVLFLLFVFGNMYSQTTYYSRQSGEWGTNSTWSTNSCNGTAASSSPSSSDSVIVCSGHTITVNNTQSCAQLNITGSSAKVLVGDSGVGGWPQTLTVTDVYIDEGGSLTQEEDNRNVEITITNLYIGTNTSSSATSSFVFNRETNNNLKISINNLIVGNCNGDGTATFNYSPNLTGGTNTLSIDDRTIHTNGSYTYGCSGGSCPAAPSTTSSPDCSTATITLSEPTLSGFSYCESSGPSSNQTYTVEGSDLTDDITITPPTNYEISDDNSTWVTSPSTLTLTESSGSVSSTTIYVRLKSGLSAGDYNSEDITHTSTDATQQDVTCSGTVSNPFISISESTFSGFSYCEGYGPSSNQSYNVSGSCISGNITITPPTNYEISDDNSTWVQSPSTITLTESGGDVASTTIYVRLKSGLSAGTYNAETITHTSSGATQQDLSNSGSVSAEPEITLASASQVSANDVEQGTSEHVLSAFTLAVTSNDATITDIDFTTTGTYDAADVSKFQLWYNTSDNLSGASQIGSNITSGLGTGSHTFSSLSQTITSGSTGYFWITTDISALSTTSNTIAVSSIATGDITISGCNSKSGSISAGGTQTIIATTVITYYSRTNGNWNSTSTWSTEGCGGAEASSYPSTTDNIVICNTNTVTANIDIETSGTVTAQSGGTLTVNENIELNSEITIESGATMNWPTTVEIGEHANIYVDGNISASSTTIVYQDDYVDINSGKIEASGTIAFSKLESSASTKGGSLKGSSITIATYGDNTTGVDV
ncbi:MAG: hypothetical protein ACOCWB_03600, partial [Bacteroidota bacterium]